MRDPAISRGEGNPGAGSTGVATRVAPTAFLALAGVAALGGLRPTIPWDAYQFLERDLLENRLAESILALHSQPPLPNLLLALALRMARWSGATPESWAFGLQLGMGLAAVAALAALAVRLVRSPLLRTILLAVVLLDPVLELALFEFFYSLHELFFLALAALFLVRFLDRDRLADLALYAGAVVGLVLTRSLYHPFWGIVALGLPLLLPRHRDSGRRRSEALLVAAATMLLFAWPLKNLLVFDFFGSSSWQGYNFSRGLAIDMRPAPLLVSRMPGPVAPELEALAAAEVPERFRKIPALARPFKRSGWPNWNNAAVIPWSRELGRRSIELLRENPASLGPKIARNYFAYCGFPGRHPYSGDLDGRAPSPFFRTWMRGFEIARYQPFPGSRPTGSPTGFALLFPVALLLVALSIGRRWREDRGATGVVLFLAGVVVWVLVLVLLVDGYEGARIRWPTEGAFLLLVGWALDGAFRNRSSSRPDDRPSSTGGGPTEGER